MIRDLRWSPAEKALACKAFENALSLELQESIREAKAMAANIENPSDLWKLELWLTQRTLDIERKHDYRYSVLPPVFINPINRGRISDDDLIGLDLAKLDLIRHPASGFQTVTPLKNNPNSNPINHLQPFSTAQEFVFAPRHANF